MPQCGYSNYVVEVLKFYRKYQFFLLIKLYEELRDYFSVDILKD